MVVFDFDGVIADSLAFCVSACSQVSSEMGGPASLENNHFADLNPLTFHALADKLGLPPKEFSDAVNRRLAETASQIPVFENMSELLRTLSETGPLAILSASHTTVIQSILRHHDLHDTIRETIGGNMAGTKAEKLAGLHVTSPGGVQAMIGDSASDMQAARTVGTHAIGVGWGWQTATRLRAAGASHVAETPEHLQVILQSVLTPA